jgi:hypothetical protein
VHAQTAAEQKAENGPKKRQKIVWFEHPVASFDAPDADEEQQTNSNGTGNSESTENSEGDTERTANDTEQPVTDPPRPFAPCKQAQNETPMPDQDVDMGEAALTNPAPRTPRTPRTQRSFENELEARMDTMNRALNESLDAAEALKREVEVLKGKLDTEHRNSGASQGLSLSSLIAKPPNFFGNDGLSVRDWLDVMADYIDTLASSNTWPRDSRVDTGYMIAKTFLRGDAARFWKETSASYRNLDIAPTWRMFKEQMCKRFDKADPVLVARNKLDALTVRACGHDVHTYVTRFDSLCAQIGTVDDEFKCHRFVQGLNTRPDIVTHVRVNPVTREKWVVYNDLRQFTLAHAASMPLPTEFPDKPSAKRSNDGFIKVDNSKKKGKPSAGNGGARSDGAANSAKTPDRPDDVRAFCMKNGLCHYCFERGHRTRECKSKASGKAAATGYPANFKKN